MSIFSKISNKIKATTSNIQGSVNSTIHKFLKSVRQNFKELYFKVADWEEGIGKKVEIDKDFKSIQDVKFYSAQNMKTINTLLNQADIPKRKIYQKEEFEIQKDISERIVLLTKQGTSYSKAKEIVFSGY